MKNSSRFSLGTKNKIKSIIDLLGIFLIICLVFVTAILSKSEFITAITISVILLIYVVQYEFSRRWVENSLLENLNIQTIGTTNAVQKIVDTTKQQKDEFTGYLQLIEGTIKTALDLKEALNKTIGAAQNVADKANQSLEYSQKEQTSVKINIDKMVNLKQKIQIIAGLILDLSEHTQQIGETIYLIEDIAEQTNMLALNAAVEAARAGENGKGFSIVAGEIRKLADESKQATSKITSLIKGIQQATNSTVMATEEGAKEIELGVELSGSINRNIDTLINVINDVKLAAEKIYADSQNQTDFSERVNSDIKTIDEGLRVSLKSFEEKIEQINSLNKLSETFKDNIV